MLKNFDIINLIFKKGESYDMKDYSLNSDSVKDFILNYRVDKDKNQIIIHLANGISKIIPFTIENEKNTLKKMKIQVLSSNEFMSKQEKRFSRSWKFAIWDASMITNSIISVVNGNCVAPTLNFLCASYLAFDIIFRVYFMLDTKRNITDIKKNKLFIDNEEEINKSIQTNQTILSKVVNKNKMQSDIAHNLHNLDSSNTLNPQQVITLNSVDKMRYKKSLCPSLCVMGLSMMIK